MQPGGVPMWDSSQTHGQAGPRFLNSHAVHTRPCVGFPGWSCTAINTPRTSERHDAVVNDGTSLQRLLGHSGWLWRGSHNAVSAGIAQVP